MVNSSSKKSALTYFSIQLHISHLCNLLGLTYSVWYNRVHIHCANHKLQIELGRQVKPVKVPVQQHYCKLCNLGAVEDEEHFLLVCPAYQSV
jgi:hypothetical protein